MSAVKVFFSHSHYNLGEELQSWLQESDTTVVGISMDSNEYGHCLVVLYEPGGGHQYEARVFFSTRHDSLEEEANQALLDAQQSPHQLVAIGSNKYGHCLCVIREL